MAKFRLGEYVAAIADYSKAIELVPTTAIHRSNRANAYRRLNRIQEAMVDVHAALHPPHESSHFSLCWIFIDAGRYQEALEAVGLAGRQQRIPEGSMLRQARIDVLMRLKRYDEALSEMTAGIKQAKIPKDKVNARLVRGCLHRQLGHFTEAEADFQLAVKQCDDLLRNGFESGELHELPTKANLELGRHEAATCGRQGYWARRKTGSVLLSPTRIRPEILFDQQRFEQAAEELAKAIKDGPVSSCRAC